MIFRCFQVLLSSSCREAGKSAFGKPEGKITGKRVFGGVFELPLLRNARKRHTQMAKGIKKKTHHLVSFLLTI
jgi:hypothetical protein